MRRVTLTCIFACGFTGFGAKANNPDPGNNNCRTHAECKAEFCEDVLTSCINPLPGTPFPPLTPEQRSTFDNCIRVMLGAHQVCVNRICVTGYNEAQVAPTSAFCRTQWEQEDSACNSAPDFCGLTYSTRVHPEIHDALKKACSDAAEMRFYRCRFHAQSTSPLGPYSFDEHAIYNEVFSQRLYEPANGRSVAELLWVPQGEGSELVSGMSYTVLLPTLSGTSLVYNSGLINAGADGLFEITLGLEDLPGSIGLSHISVMVDWLDSEGEYLWNTPFSLTIPESGIPGDFDRNGVRDANDLAAFLDAYNNNAPRADLNRDGVVDAADLELFLMQFEGE